MRRRLPFLLPAALAGLFACFLLTEYDVCWHLRAGEWMLREGRLLREDVFSHTIPGRPWLNFEWLSQVLFAALVRLGSLDALIAFKMALTAGAFLLAASAARRLGAGPWGTASVLLLGILAAHERFFARPDMFTHLGAAWTVLAYLRLCEGRRWPLLALPAAQALWANLHGGFIVGPLIGTAFLAGEGLNRVLRSPERDLEAGVPVPGAPLRILGGILGSLGACLATPFGAELVLYPFREVSLGRGSPSVFLQTIAEWQSPFSEVQFHHPMLAAFYLWIALWAGVLLLRAGQADFRGVCLALGCLVLAASARRHVSVGAIATAPFLAAELWRAGSRRSPYAAAGVGGVLSAAAAWICLEGRHPPLVAASLLLPPAYLLRGLAAPLRRSAAVLAPSLASWGLGATAFCALSACWGHALVTDAFNRAYYSGRVFGFGADAASYPEGAVRFLERSGMKGRLFNNLTAGGYLAWRAPAFPVFIDGRNLLYGEAFFGEYLQALQTESAWRELEARYGLDLALVASGEAIGSLADRLATDPRWVLAYADLRGRLFVRRTPEREPLLAGLGDGPACFRLSQAPAGPPPAALARAAVRLQRLFGADDAFFLKEAASLGAALEEQGRFREALACHARVLRSDPGNLGALLGTARMHERLGLGALAEPVYRKLLSLRDEPGVWVKLGTLLMSAGRAREAQVAFARAGAREPEPFNVLGARALGEGRAEEALGYFRKAAALAPQHPGILLNLATALESLGRGEEAVGILRDVLEISPRSEAGERLIRSYTRALQERPESGSLANDLGTVFHAQGRQEEAEAWYRRALEAEPGLEGVRPNLAILACERGRAAEARDWVLKMQARGEAPPPRVLRWLESRGD